VTRALTARESEALRRVANGETYRQIAADWGVEEITVRTTGSRVLRKLGANNIAHAVHLAYQAGILRRERHGDHAGYAAHIYRRETPCDPCKAGEREYRNGRRNQQREAAA
jgi:DNA-binding CsgD family transcriptional regulator